MWELVRTQGPQCIVRAFVNAMQSSDADLRRCKRMLTNILQSLLCADSHLSALERTTETTYGAYPILLLRSHAFQYRLLNIINVDDDGSHFIQC
jgi:hypothetical protein